MNLILKNVRGQCYHRAVSMAGIKSNVSKKKKVKLLMKNVLYNHLCGLNWGFY